MSDVLGYNGRRVVLLNSQLAGVINGGVLPVDGGFMGALTTGQIDLSKLMGRAQPAPFST